MPAKKKASTTGAAHRCAVTLGRLGGLASAKKRRTKTPKRGRK